MATSSIAEHALTHEGFALSLYMKIGYGKHRNLKLSLAPLSLTAGFCLLYPVKRYDCRSRVGTL
jgi:hypothetical protein